MQLKEMFAKKIDREIQGVIIVGQGEDFKLSAPMTTATSIRKRRIRMSLPSMS